MDNQSLVELSIQHMKKAISALKRNCTKETEQWKVEKTVEQKIRRGTGAPVGRIGQASGLGHSKETSGGSSLNWFWGIGWKMVGPEGLEPSTNRF